jgi:hypothetical protein
MRYIITHGHIFKNAGTTFDYALEKAFGKDFCDHRDDVDMRRGGEAYLKQFILDNPNLKAISSHHLCNPLPKSDEFTCIPVYFVRNPIERIISVYNFERKQKKGSLGAEMASKLSLNDYIRWRMTPDAPKVIFDYQTAYIGRTRNLRPNERVSSTMLQRAINMINDSSIYVGTVERFDESFQYITSQLKTFFPEVEFQYKRKNVTNSSSLDDKYSRALKDMTPVLSEVIGRNAYDMALYEAADQKLDELLEGKNFK